jgi:chromosome segregation ATPase
VSCIPSANRFYSLHSLLYPLLELKALRELKENTERELQKRESIISDLKSKLETLKNEEVARKDEVRQVKNEHRSLDQRHRELQVAYDTLEEESNSLKEKLAASRKKCNDALLQDAESRTEAEELKKEVDGLKDKVADLKLQCDHHKKIAASESEELKALKVVEKDLQNQLQEANSQNASASKNIEELKATVESLTKLQADSEAAKQSALSELASTSTALEDAKRTVQDQVLEHKIANRKNIQLIKDLKSQLAKITGEMEELRRSPPLPEKDEASAPQPQPSPVAGKRPELSSANSGGSDSGGGAEDDEIKRMLAQRLTMLLNENAVVREKLKYMEGSVQALTIELDQKKNLLAQYQYKETGKAAIDEVRPSDVARLQATCSKEELTNLIASLMSERNKLSAEVDMLNKKFGTSRRSTAASPPPPPINEKS